MRNTYSRFFRDLDFDINNISKTEMKTFFSLFIGMECFFNNEKLKFLTKQKFQKENKRVNYENVRIKDRYSMRFRVDDNKYLLIDAGEGKIIYLNNTKEAVINEINSILDYETVVYRNDSRISLSKHRAILQLFLDVAHNDFKNIENIQDKFRILKTLYSANMSPYRFVVGAGINFGFKMKTWEELEKDFNKTIDNILDKEEVANDIVKKVFNANYGTFQILKDLDLRAYYNELESLVSPIPNPPSISDGKTMEAIIRVLDYQKEVNRKSEQNLITFNYDNLIELFLNYSDVKSVFKYDAEKNSRINIIHSHGLLPTDKGKRCLPQDKYYDSIVLTTNEYFDNYKTSRSYGYKELYNHLNNTCFFIGNSITDYEEQKVINAHFKDNPSQFHFAFLVRNPNEAEVDYYKTIFLLKIGIIPLWYNSHDEYADELINNCR